MNLRDTMCTYLAKMWKYIYSFINTDRVGINTTSYRIEYKIIVLRHKDFTMRIDSNFKHTVWKEQKQIYFLFKFRFAENAR